MKFSNIESFAHLLELSFSPIVLISGVGLLLLSMVNRFMQATSRTRQLLRVVEQQEGEERQGTIEQINILYKRSNILKTAIILVSCSIFSTGLLIVVISVMSFEGVQIEYLATALYYLSIALMIASVLFFVFDLTMSTRALRVEVSKYLDIDS